MTFPQGVCKEVNKSTTQILLLCFHISHLPLLRIEKITSGENCQCCIIHQAISQNPSTLVNTPTIPLKVRTTKSPHKGTQAFDPIFQGNPASFEQDSQPTHLERLQTSAPHLLIRPRLSESSRITKGWTLEQSDMTLQWLPFERPVQSALVRTKKAWSGAFGDVATENPRKEEFKWNSCGRATCWVSLD